MEAQITLMPKSYWSSTGIYQEQFDKLYEKMVPSEGRSTTLNGELIRAISRLFYEYCNNGNCNSCETHYEDEEYFTGEYDEDGDEIWDSEEVETDSNVSRMYSEFLSLIDSTVPGTNVLVNKIENIITSNSYGSRENFSDERMNVYNELCDRVIFYVLNNEDKEIPSFYKN
jgi:hypothetical protein